MYRLLSYGSSRAQDGLALNEVGFSAARYEPMARLLSEDDLVFLKAQPGFRPAMGRKFSRERRRIFRLYLQELSADFHRLHADARRIAVTLPAEDSALIGMLMRQQVRFWYEMAAIRLRLSLDLTVHARGLLDALAAMHVEVRMALAAAS